MTLLSACDKPGYRSIPGCTALVTGSSGLCGARLVEILLERGAKTVIAFDIAHPDHVPYLKQRFETIQAATGGKIIIRSNSDGDLKSQQAIDAAFESATTPVDICFHVGAIVGPFFPNNVYYDVNTLGTKRIISACLKYKCPKLVYSSSPTTRISGQDVTGQTEDELSFPTTYLAKYAETKALGEMEVSKACCDQLLTVSVAPHQVYGPYDNLMLPNFLETAANGRLRIFGPGHNKISVCFVDNYVHGLLCGADALRQGSPALANFYIITDGEPIVFWKMLNLAIVDMGFTDLYSKFHLPIVLLYTLAYIASAIGFVTNQKFKLSPFNVRMLTMNRYFSIERAKRDLLYEPLVSHDKAWSITRTWFQENWLPKYKINATKQKKVV